MFGQIFGPQQERGHQDQKKYMKSILNVPKSISESFKAVGQKLSKILVHLYFVGAFFLSLVFD